MVILANLRAPEEPDEALPEGLARVYVVPERIWDKLGVDGAWPERLMPAEDGSPARRQLPGVPLPRGLWPSEGGWPQVISGKAARKLCKQPKAVSRIVATVDFLDGWWLKDLLTINMSPAEAASVIARIEYRYGDRSPGSTSAIKQMIARNRSWYAADVESGRCSWT